MLEPDRWPGKLEPEVGRVAIKALYVNKRDTCNIGVEGDENGGFPPVCYNNFNPLERDYKLNWIL